MAITPKLDIPYLVEGQLSGEVTHNEALIRLDSLAQISVIDRDLDTPPGGESDGDTYLVKAVGAGAWTGHDGELAMYYNSAWIFTVVFEGMSLWIQDENIRLDYDGTVYNATSAAEAQVYYVGKHGVDTATGKSQASAVLTFGQAITLANAETPAVDNLFAIVCLDAGIYAESLTIPSYVYILAPSAAINGTHVIADEAKLTCNRITLAAGVAITKSAGVNHTCVCVNHLILTGNAEGVECTSGRLVFHFHGISVVDGSAIGEGSDALLNIVGNHISITGAGVGINMDTAGGEITGHVGAIYETGTGTGISVANGALANLCVADLQCDTTAYNVAAGGQLNLSVDAISGTQTETGIVALVAPNPTTHLTPAVIVADQHNYNPAGLASTKYLRLSAAAGREITGIMAPTVNTGRRELIILHIGAGTLSLMDQDVASDAANRFDLVADIVMPTDSGVLLVYDNIDNRWRCAGKYIA